MTLIPRRLAKLHSNSTPGLIASLKAVEVPFQHLCVQKGSPQMDWKIQSSATAIQWDALTPASAPACEGLNGQQRSAGVIE